MGSHAQPVKQQKMKILFFCPINPTRPTGGVLVIFRCVDILRAHGLDASVVALPLANTSNSSDITWFESTAPVISWETACQLPSKDCVHVLLEDFCMGWNQDAISSNGHTLDLSQARLILLAQNRRDMYRNLSKQWPKLPSRDETILGRSNLLGVMCVSALEQTYWNTLYPDINVWCKPNSIDTTVFKPATVRENIAAFIGKPGTTLSEAQHLMLALRHSGLAKDWRFCNLQGKPQHEVAQTMATADLFLTFGTMESFGLAAAEAMASGCIVIGYHGGVPEEFFNPRWSYPVQPLDYLGYVQMFQKMQSDRSRNTELFEEKRRLGREHIERNFSPAREAQALMAIFGKLLS